MSTERLDILDKKKAYIKTYGCQMNVYDSEMIGNILGKIGYDVEHESESHQDADLIVLNTCHIREKAVEKVYSELGRIRRTKKKDAIVIMAGCVAQAEGEEVFKRMPFVDMVVGPQNIHELPAMLEKHQVNLKQTGLDFAIDNKFDFLKEEFSSNKTSVFLPVQEGCDKFCTFCCVPYTRGPEYSRSVPEIMREAMQYSANKCKEITLLGQNVTAYHGLDEENNSWSLGKLLKHIAKIRNIERIRYTTSHPIDMHDELYEAHETIEKLMPYLHLPVQSGSDKILHKMNRKHTVAEYLTIIGKLKRIRPDLAFSSDIIVGFPGETDDDFEHTMLLVKEANFTQCFTFKYSPRPGTPGAVDKNQIPEDVKDDRLARLNFLVRAQQLEFNKLFEGKIVPALIVSENNKNQLIGKSPHMQNVHIDSNNNKDKIGQTVNVRITKCMHNSLYGNIE